MARPITSVIVSARNNANVLEACLRSLRAQRSSVPFEVHVVEHDSSDRTYALARRLTKDWPNFFIWKEKKPGCAAAKNHGAKKARGKILLFTDAYCQFSPRWVEQMSLPLLEPCHYPLAAVGGVTEQGENSRLWDRYLNGLYAFWEKDRLGSKPAFLPWAPAANFAVIADLFRAFQGFDERLRWCIYDVDFCWRLHLSGFVLGRAPNAQLSRYRRHTLRGLLRRMENYSYYHQSLLAIYQRELNLPALGGQLEKFLGRSQKLISRLRSTTNLSEAKFRLVDGLVSVAIMRGLVKAQLLGVKADPKFSACRRGITPMSLTGRLPRGYSHLHQDGWVYWKIPAAVDAPGALQLFRPSARERFRLDPIAWRIWEVKAEKGQSEDAAEALGKNPADEEILHGIDRLTVDLRTRRLLPTAELKNKMQNRTRPPESRPIRP
jgi:glycosyltransferase involved in cell wall biosynthesis